jgi:hypothetical protein
MKEPSLGNVTDDILVIVGIMVLLSLFLFRW